MDGDRLDELLREGGLKATPKRRLVAEYLLARRATRTPEQVWRQLRRKLGALGLPTIYRILEELVSIGILTRVEWPDRNLRYAPCHAEHGRHHHHVVCTECGRVGEVKACTVDEQKRAIERASGFRVLSHRLQIEGLCPRCR
jgi:Fur family ferric uptake transcriptional regulator